MAPRIENVINQLPLRVRRLGRRALEGIPSLDRYVRSKFKEATPQFGQKFYGQFGEDVIIDYFFQWKQIETPTYLDIGAFHPVEFSNTYRFYQKGSRGVLVEPTLECCDALRTERSGDIVLNCAIRTQDMPAEVDFYVLEGGALNTIVRREAEFAVETQGWGPQRIREIRKVPALTINEVLQRHFPNGVDLIDIDIEGLDYEIMREIDYERFRPHVVSVEIHGGHYAEKQADGRYTHLPAQAFVDFMKMKDYRLLVPIKLNGIFVRD
jgi:FkbM family methyltransferase